MRAALLLLLGASTSCADRAIEVPLDGYSFEYAFMLLLDGDEKVTRASPPFGIANGEVTFGELPAFMLEPAEKRVALVGLPEASVRTSVPLFDETRAGELELNLDPMTDLPFYEGPSVKLQIALPAEAQLLGAEFDAELGATPLNQLIALEVPIAPESCGRAEALTAFGTSVEIIEGDELRDHENFLQVEHLDADTVIAMTPRNLHLFRAGETYVPLETSFDTRGNRFGDKIPGEGVVLGGFALDRAAGKLWLAMGTTLEAPRTDALLYEIAVDAAGFTLVRTATLTGASFGDVALDADAWPIVLTYDATVVRYDGSFHELPKLTGLKGEEGGIRIIATGDAEAPYLVSTHGQVHVFEDGGWSAFRIPFNWLRNSLSSQDFNASGLASRRTANGELELLAAGSGSLLIHRVGAGPWSTLDVPLPPRFTGCVADGQYPNLVATEGFDSIRPDGADLFISVRECGAVLQVRSEAQCTALITVAGAPPIFQASDLQALDVLGDSLIVGGEEGLLYRTRLR